MIDTRQDVVVECTNGRTHVWSGLSGDTVYSAQHSVVFADGSSKYIFICYYCYIMYEYMHLNSLVEIVRI